MTKHGMLSFLLTSMNLLLNIFCVKTIWNENISIKSWISLTIKLWWHGKEWKVLDIKIWEFKTYFWNIKNFKWKSQELLVKLQTRAEIHLLIDVVFNTPIGIAILDVWLVTCDAWQRGFGWWASRHVKFFLFLYTQFVNFCIQFVEVAIFCPASRNRSLVVADTHPFRNRWFLYRAGPVRGWWGRPS